MIKYPTYGLACLLAIGSIDATAANQSSIDGVVVGNSSNSVQFPNFDNSPAVNQAADADAPQGSAYLFVAGSAFTPRTSSQIVTYPGGGCASSDLALTTSLDLPDGAVVYGVRMYYYSVSAAANLNVFLTSYQGLGASSDLITGVTTLSSGYSDQYFTPDSALNISNFSNAYVLTALADAGTRLCGMRVFYSP